MPRCSIWTNKGVKRREQLLLASEEGGAARLSVVSSLNSSDSSARSSCASHTDGRAQQQLSVVSSSFSRFGGWPQRGLGLSPSPRDEGPSSLLSSPSLGPLHRAAMHFLVASLLLLWLVFSCCCCLYTLKARRWLLEAGAAWSLLSASERELYAPFERVNWKEAKSVGLIFGGFFLVRLRRGRPPPCGSPSLA